MAIINYHDLDELKNRNEESVWKAIEIFLNRNEKICRCRDCILDAAALTLNSLPPRYQVYAFHSNTPQEKDPTQEITDAVARAFDQVSNRPHHF